MTTKETTVLETEQEFNESELENIMSEIESLESEFVSENVETTNLALDKANVSPNDFQEEVDEAISILGDEDSDCLEKEIEQVNKEMAEMTKKSTTTTEIKNSPIIPTEQVIDVKTRPDTSAIFSELPNKRKQANKAVTQQAETVVLTKKLEPDLTFEEVISEGIASVETQEPVLKEETVIKIEPPIQETVQEASKVKEKQTETNNIVPFIKETKMSTKNTQGKCDTTMNFTVSGQMNLNLNFTVGGQDIQLSISEEEGFCITMGSGVKFSVPIEKLNSMKAQKAS